MMGDVMVRAYDKYRETIKTYRGFVGKLEGIRQLEKHRCRSGIIRVLK
jgi:hypothetical protein